MVPFFWLLEPGTQHSLRENAAMSAAFGLIVIFLLNCDGSCISGGGLLQIRETERDLGIERRPRRGPVTPALLKSLECDMLPLAPWNLPQGVRTDASNVAVQIGVDIALLHGSGVYEENWTDLINVDGLSLTTVRERSTSWLSICSKRVTDVVISSLLLVLLAPLYPDCDLDPAGLAGPALFIQRRAGAMGSGSIYTNSAQCMPMRPNMPCHRLRRTIRGLHGLGVSCGG